MQLRHKWVFGEVGEVGEVAFFIIFAVPPLGDGRDNEKANLQG